MLALPELFYTIQVIYNRTQQVIPLLMVATVWYLFITTALSVIQYTSSAISPGRGARTAADTLAATGRLAKTLGDPHV